MKKRVLSIGQCQPDHVMLRRLVEGRYDAELVPAVDWDDAERQLASGEFVLVLVNRKLDIDYSDGLEIIRRLKNDARLAETPVMMVTNFAEHQQQAVAAGAAYGFGKSELGAPTTHERLSEFLATA